MVAPSLQTLAQHSRRHLLREAAERVGLLTRRRVPVFYDPNYRLPFSSLEATRGAEPRRADFVVWYLLENGLVGPDELRAPRRAFYADLARVHSAEFLESLSRPEPLASIFAVDPSDLLVEETMNTVRLSCGGTLDAARTALHVVGPTVNLLGGYHHAFPNKGSGMCPVNDIAVAIAVLRGEGFTGRVAIIDLDAHPPDGTHACLRGDPLVWIGSLSGSFWQPLDGADETVLPPGCDDEKYLRALHGLLGRMPEPALAFVIAGGDVLAGDRFGRLGLTLAGARRRDLKVAEALQDVPSVWLPGGGYHANAWKVLAGTVIALSRRSTRPIPEKFDPLSARYAQIWQNFGNEQTDRFELSAEDIEGTLGRHGPERYLLLGRYSTEAIELALDRCGILGHLRRLGFDRFRVEVDEASPGDRLRLFGEYAEAEHLLMEAVLERRKLADAEALYVHWMTLRNPKASFSDRRPQLPGQEKPGLGLTHEGGEMLARVARQLGLQVIAFRPAWFHMAYAARSRFRYLDPRRQGRFEAILRDLGSVPLREATLAFAEGRVWMNGVPYSFEADEMVCWLTPRKEDRRAIESERARVFFTLVPKVGVEPQRVGASASPGEN